MDMQAKSLLVKLITRGDSISIDGGRLKLAPKSEKEVPEDWLSEFGSLLIDAILEVTDIDAYRYSGYSTGNYDKGRYSGISIQFEKLVNCESTVCFFNVGTTRLRNSPHGRAGDPLPKGHFYALKNGKFVKFWIRLGMKPPRRLSEYHEKMWQLGEVLLAIKIGPENKADKDSIDLLEIPHSLILSMVRKEERSATDRQLSGSASATDRQLIGKPSATTLGNDVGRTRAGREAWRNSTTCAEDHEIRKEETSQQEVSNQEHNSSFTIPKDVRDQTREEWLNDCFGQKH
jgi:hypothetical protein